MEELKKLILIMGEKWFTATFLEWLENHDDEEISCMTDVIDTLTDDINEEFSNA